MLKIRTLMFVVLGVCSVFAIGCNQSEPESVQFVEVHGEVFLDDLPVGKARVLFVPENPEVGQPFFVSMGTTNFQGEFQLQRLDGEEGAMTGKHRVYISRTEKANQASIGTDAPAEEEDAAESSPSAVRQFADLIKAADPWGEDFVPSYYNRQSELDCEIVAGGGIQRVRFDLSSIDPMLNKEPTGKD